MGGFCLEVCGDFACFTRPEMKAERVSYDVMTPSAARAVFEAILWKPGLRWQIEKIEVLKPIRWISVRRNEVGAKLSVSNIQTAMKRGRGDLALYVEDERQQRAGLLLRDVAYRLHAHMELLSDEVRANPGKYAEMFVRRARKGQCVNQPYLGCREFAASFRLIEDLAGEPAPITESRDLGWMLYDMNFVDVGNPLPQFFHARLDVGVVHVNSERGVA
jgi:CRISPR-associated protein Cas5d